MIEETIVITVSKLIKDGDSTMSVLPEEATAALEAIVSELIQDETAMIEVAKIGTPE